MNIGVADGVGGFVPGRLLEELAGGSERLVESASGDGRLQSDDLEVASICGSSTWPISPSTSVSSRSTESSSPRQAAITSSELAVYDPSRRGLVLGERIGEDFLRLLELPDGRVGQRHRANLEQQLGPIAETLGGSIGLFAQGEAR